MAKQDGVDPESPYEEFFVLGLGVLLVAGVTYGVNLYLDYMYSPVDSVDGSGKKMRGLRETLTEWLNGSGKKLDELRTKLTEWKRRERSSETPKEEQAKSSSTDPRSSSKDLGSSPKDSRSKGNKE